MPSTQELASSLDHVTALPAPFVDSPALRVGMLPRDTNAHGTIFGGVILSHLDYAGAVVAMAAGCHRVVTVLMREVTFVQPVFVGDILSLYGEPVKLGNTSITVRVRVHATRYESPHDTVKVTEAEITYVNVDANRRPVPIPRPGAAKGLDQKPQGQ